MPVTRAIRWLNGLVVLAVGAGFANAQTPTGFFACGAQCQEALSQGMLVVDCGTGEVFTAFSVGGRWWWGPLLCVGGVEVSIQAPRVVEPAHPLFVEVRRDNRAPLCSFMGGFPGNLVWQTKGVAQSCDPDSMWVVSPILDLPSIVGLGNQYWLQIEGFTSYDPGGWPTASSPYVACIRLRVATSVATATWSRVKALYKE
jgi:hypothetical protein